MSGEFFDDVNPYAAPRPAPPALPLWCEGGLWRDGRLLVVAKGTEFPDRCVKCNAPAEGYRLRRFIAWHHPAYYVGLCKRHRRKRRNALIISIAMNMALVALFIVSRFQDSGGLMLFALVLGLYGAIFGTMRAQIVRGKRTDATHVWIAGVSKEFLACVPKEWA